MSYLVKHKHEYELKNGKRILDPIGKTGFSKYTNANKDDKIYGLDLNTSSNFYVNITQYMLTTNWIKFYNYENIHRFDVVVGAETGSLFPGYIKFGDGNNEYEQPQLNIGTIQPKIFWLYNNPYPLLESLRTNRSVIITFRYGIVYTENGIENGFIGYLPFNFKEYPDTTTTSEPTTTTTTIDPELTLFIPEAFSPNDDGINDYFVIYLVDGYGSQYPLETLYPNTKMYIYINDGGVIIDSLVIEPYHDNFWDGRDSDGDLVPIGTHYYSFLYGKENESPGDSGEVNSFVYVTY